MPAGSTSLLPVSTSMTWTGSSSSQLALSRRATWPPSWSRRMLGCRLTLAAPAGRSTPVSLPMSQAWHARVLRLGQNSSSRRQIYLCCRDSHSGCPAQSGSIQPVRLCNATHQVWILGPSPLGLPRGDGSEYDQAGKARSRPICTAVVVHVIIAELEWPADGKDLPPLGLRTAGTVVVSVVSPE